MIDRRRGLLDRRLLDHRFDRRRDGDERSVVRQELDGVHAARSDPNGSYGAFEEIDYVCQEGFTVSGVPGNPAEFTARLSASYKDEVTYEVARVDPSM